MTESEETQFRKAQAHIAGYVEFMRATEAFLNNIADDIRGMEDSSDKDYLWAFFRKHTIPYGQQVNFLQQLYNPQIRGDENE